MFVSAKRVCLPRRDRLQPLLVADTVASGFCNGTAVNAGDSIQQRCSAKTPRRARTISSSALPSNVTLGLRWSEDAIDDEPAQMMNLIGVPGDQMRVTHNLTTYAVISLFGWGLGVFDDNAIESNEVPAPRRAASCAKEQVALRAYAEDPAMFDRLHRVEAVCLVRESAINYIMMDRTAHPEVLATPTWGQVGLTPYRPRLAPAC